jgi:GNAT superfamily N-acetyltransferase
MRSLRIRPATPDDAASLCGLLDQLGYPTDSAQIPERIEKLHARPGTKVLVAENEAGEVVGVATIHLFDSLHASEPVAWLTTVVVEERARGQGIGSALVARAEKWAVDHGARRISLTSALRREHAHEFYKARDYEHTGVRLSKVLSAGSSVRAHAKTDAEDFHVMEFAHHDEAAAFVAALSRFLDSPRAPAPETRVTPIEVWARSPVASEGVRLFLSATALDAARNAFSPVSIVRTVTRDALPDESFLIIEAGVTPAWGAAEASARLSSQ